MSIFTSSFVKAARSYIKDRCAGNQRVSREEVSTALEQLGYKISPELLANAISDGVFNTTDWACDLFQGRYGGIREVDLEAVRAEEERQAKIRARIEKAKATRAAKKQTMAETASVAVEPVPAQ